GWSDGLEAMLRDLKDADALFGTGFSDEDLARLARGRREVQEIPAELDRADELQAKWKTQTGQLWCIAGHRLLCGDATKAADVARLMNHALVSVCFTSPPYLQQREYTVAIDDWDALMKGAFLHLPMREEGQLLVNLGLIHRDGEWLPYWDGW